MDDRVLVPGVITVDRVDVVTHDRLVQDQPIVVDDPGPRHDTSTINNASLSTAPNHASFNLVWRALGAGNAFG